MRKLLLTGAFKYSSQQMSLLEELGYEIIYIQDEREKLEIDVSDIEAVVCNGLFLHNSIELFKSLKLIQLTSAGFDRVPMEYIKSKGIKIYNAQGVYSIPMAEWVVLKILEIYKNSRQFYISQQAKDWSKRRNLLELSGRKALILGYGNVGREVAKRLSVFGVEIIGVDKRHISCPFVSRQYSINELQSILWEIDIFVITLPYTQETHHLLDHKIFNRMKDKCVLINVSRGGVISEQDLIEVLYEKKFLGVALDVFEQEPLVKESPLWEFENVYITPHNSFISDQIDSRLFNLIVKNLK